MRRAADVRRAGSGFKNALANNSLGVRQAEAGIISKRLEKKLDRLLGESFGISCHRLGDIVGHKNSWWRFVVLMIFPGTAKIYNGCGHYARITL
jgi:hypothetical protein